MSLTTGMAVVIPHSQLSEIAGGVKVEFVPILRYECHSLWISALASNNPWDVDVRGGCGSVSVHMSGDSGPSSASNDDDNCTTGLLVREYGLCLGGHSSVISIVIMFRGPFLCHLYCCHFPLLLVH